MMMMLLCEREREKEQAYEKYTTITKSTIPRRVSVNMCV